MGRPRLAHAVDERGCWIWQGKLQKGRAWCYRRYYIEAKGPIPDGLELDHTCRVPACVNPDHLEPVTREVNEQRKYLAGCRSGHPWTPATEYRDKNGWRRCRLCNAAKSRRARATARAITENGYAA